MAFHFARKIYNRSGNCPGSVTLHTRIKKINTINKSIDLLLTQHLLDEQKPLKCSKPKEEQNFIRLQVFISSSTENKSSQIVVKRVVATSTR